MSASVSVDVFDAGGATVSTIVQSLAGNTVTLRNLPSDQPLTFRVVVGMGSDGTGSRIPEDNQTGLGVSRATLASGQTNDVDNTIFMNGGDLSGANTTGSGSQSSGNTLSMRFKLRIGAAYLFTPAVTARDAGNSPVSCFPTFSMRAGQETPTAMGQSASSSAAFMATGTGGWYDVQATSVASCGASAAVITRSLKAERVADVNLRLN